jgi:predicted RNA binding protein YcfA (HicA-like mRNA interferase family)
MARLPVVSGKELIALLEKDGFRDELARDTLLGIMKQCGLSKDDLHRLMKK